MGNRILIIAAYNGEDRHRTGYPPCKFLDTQFQQLSTLKHSLDKVVIVYNDTHVNGDDRREFEKSLEQFPNVLRRQNIQGSYGAWKDGYQTNPDYEWYFFIEDDYTFFIDDFDQKWIDLWEPETSYIATKAGRDWGHPYHASIANGLTRGDILKDVNWDSMSAQLQYDGALQLGWSGLFNGAGLRDIREHYAAPYYVRFGIPVTDYGNPNLPILIGPVQLILDQQIKEVYEEHRALPFREVDPMRHRQRMVDDPDYRLRIGAE